MKRIFEDNTCLEYLLWHIGKLLGFSQLIRKMQTPARLRISIFRMRPGRDTCEENPNHVPFPSEGKQPVHDLGQPGPAVAGSSGRRPWVSQELEEHLSVCNTQLQFDRPYAENLQAQNDIDYKLESSQLDNLMSLSRRQCKAHQEILTLVGFITDGKF